MTDKTYPILEQIDSPTDLKALDTTELPALAEELRAFILDTVSQTGGHLASNLGTVELTIALHRVFDTPRDQIIWDVGHQSYPHKILTGRRKQMATLRKQHGLSGFPKRGESPHDSFGVGHSSTSISAALGMSIAQKDNPERGEYIAVIGDGAMTAGMAFEAMNHAGGMDADVIVILNDNEMSISPNVGGMSKYLTRILSSRLYSNMRESSKKVLKHMGGMWELARRTEEHMKGMIIPGTLFEELGFHYYGPIDGHDLGTLTSTLKNLKQLKGPRILHIVTSKGKGYKYAENDPCSYHGVSSFDPANGVVAGKGKKAQTYTQVFGDWLCDMARADTRLLGITPAMREGSGLVAFSEEFPERYIDVGIAEQHAVTLAAGMACEGMKPVVAIYSTFLQRAYDQLIHDVAIQNLPVLFAIDRAGLVGADGPTHAGTFDLSFLRCVPNMLVMAPADENECRKMLTTGYLHDGPAAVRYPRGAGIGAEIDPGLDPLPIGKGHVLREGRDIALLMFGSLTDSCLEAAQALNATLVNMRFIKPLDTDLIDQIAEKHRLIVTLEDNVVAGGAGSAVSEYLSSARQRPDILHLGLPDDFVEHGERNALLAQCGLDADGITRAVRTLRPQVFVKGSPLG